MIVYPAEVPAPSIQKKYDKNCNRQGFYYEILTLKVCADLEAEFPFRDLKPAPKDKRSGAALKAKGPSISIGLIVSYCIDLYCIVLCCVVLRGAALCCSVLYVESLHTIQNANTRRKSFSSKS